VEAPIQSCSSYGNGFDQMIREKIAKHNFEFAAKLLEDLCGKNSKEACKIFYEINENDAAKILLKIDKNDSETTLAILLDYKSNDFAKSVKIMEILASHSKPKQKLIQFFNKIYSENQIKGLTILTQMSALYGTNGNPGIKIILANMEINNRDSDLVIQIFANGNF
jgi:hypothetical protein